MRNAGLRYFLCVFIGGFELGFIPENEWHQYDRKSKMDMGKYLINPAFP